MKKDLILFIENIDDSIRRLKAIRQNALLRLENGSKETSEEEHSQSYKV